MDNQLDQVLTRMKDKYQNHIQDNSGIYMDVDIGKEAEAIGLSDLKDKYRNVYAVIPMKEAFEGIKVLIDGRTFVNYVQFESGIAAPGFIVKDSRLPHKKYVAKDSMVYNFA
ncbi:MAG: hypothetical protein V2B19_22100 [Pseudomonadota bacterium]